MTDQTNFLTQLVAAQQALEAKPELEAAVARAQGEAIVIRERFAAECAHSETLREMVAEKNTALAEKEAALRDATFREQQLRDQLAMFTTLLKGVVGEANAAIELVEPKPEPVIETVPVSIEATPVPNDGAEVTGSTGGESVSASTDTTDLPGKFPWEAPKVLSETVTDPEDAYLYAAPYGYREPSTEAAREPEVNPTSASSMDGQTAPSQVAIEAASSPRPYWEKPSNTTWFDWRAAGNEIAPWCRNSSDDVLRSIFN